ncbi:unnamed protein product, partial [Staurois parvus]
SPAFVSTAFNYRVLAGDYSLAPSDCRASPTRRRTVCKQNSSPPCRLMHTAFDGYAQQKPVNHTNTDTSKTAHS